MTDSAEWPEHIDGAGASFEEATVTWPFGTIRYWHAGTGEPTLVHIHGGTGPTLTRAHDVLSQHRRVVLFEIPGYGDSPDDERIANRHDLATALWAAIEGVVGDAPIALLGSSLGGGTAMWLAIERPPQVTQLVLESPSAIRPEGVVEERVPPEEMARRAFFDPERMLALLPKVSAENRPPPPAIMRRLIGPPRDHDLEAALSGLTVPTLVVFGRHDGLVPPVVGRLYRQLLPVCTLAIIDGAAHAISEERPEALAGLVNDFLEGAAGFAELEADVVVVP